jgi:hypothetical protein
MKKDEAFNSTPNYSGITTLNKCMHIILFYWFNLLKQN